MILELRTNPLLNPNYCSSSFSNPSPFYLILPRRKLHYSPFMALSVTRSKHRSLTNPSLIHLFSTSFSSTTPPSDQSTPENGTSSQFRQQQEDQQQQFSQFSDVKASLKQHRQNPQYLNQPNKPNFPPLRNPSNSATKASSLEEIRKSLTQFRLRSTVPPPIESNTAGSPSHPPQVSLQELYNRSRLGKSEDVNGSNESTTNSINTSIAGKLSFQKIRERVQQMKNNDSLNRDSGRDPLSFSALKASLNLKPANESEPTKSSVIGGAQGLPLPVFRKEDANVKARTGTEFVKWYTYGELGEKLRSLRPEVKEGEKGWFSLEELNGRLRNLRALEEKETGLSMSGLSIRDLRESLVTLEKAKQSSSQKLNLLGQLGVSFIMHPPKEHLVEKYFHPDNMSSAEKLKIELAKVREEFKMSESDCGSTRVQVAQLTTKIKHLSSVLHKKDKHSRKGLQEMVQKRKKLLKYVRRTDWDSYCFVLSKLGLRDNPDFKN